MVRLKFNLQSKNAESNNEKYSAWLLTHEIYIHKYSKQYSDAY